MRIDREAYIRSWVDRAMAEPSIRAEYSDEEIRAAAEEGVDRFISWALHFPPYETSVKVPGHKRSLIFEMPIVVDDAKPPTEEEP
jgi:hypothetical protein